MIFFFSKPARCGHTQSALGTYLYRAHKTPHTVLLCARISREKCQMSRTESRMFSINYFRKKIKTRRNAYTEKTRLKHICAVTRGSSESAPSAPPMAHDAPAGATVPRRSEHGRSRDTSALPPPQSNSMASIPECAWPLWSLGDLGSGREPARTFPCEPSSSAARMTLSRSLGAQIRPCDREGEVEVERERWREVEARAA